MLKRIPSTLLYLLLTAILIVSSSVPASAQIIHENPDKISPSTDTNVEDELNAIIDALQIRIELISIDLKNNNFTYAKDRFYRLNNSVNEYNDLLWRMNLSDSVYESIANNINFTRDQLDLFIQNSEYFNQSLEQYNQSISTGDISGANISAIKAHYSYEQLTEAYDRLRANTTAIEKVLVDNNIDTDRFRNSLANIDNYMIDLNAQYNGPDSTNGSDLRLAIEPDTPSLGQSVNISTSQMGKNGIPTGGAVVNIYFNGVIVGRYTSNDDGTGFISYVIPVNSSSDTIYAHAESIPKDLNQSRSFSNVIILYIPDKGTSLTLVPDRSTISYGDPVRFTGSLTATDGMPAPGKIVTIYMNDEYVGHTFTDKNGTYNYTYNVMPDTLAGKNTFFASYDRISSNAFLSTASTSYSITIVPKNTRLYAGNVSGLSIGDIGRVKGVLKTEDNVSVEGAFVNVYVDGKVMGNNTTDNKGEYDIVIYIPDNVTVGTHELYTAFEPDSGLALHNSTSSLQYVTFENSVQTLTVEGLPLIVFTSDTLNINGTLLATSGMPIPDKTFNVTTSRMQIGTFVTDQNGHFNASYFITGNESPGYYTLSIDELNNEGIPPINRYIGHVIVVPYDKYPSLGAFVLVIIAIIAVTVFIIRSRHVIRLPEQVIVDSISEPMAIPAESYPESYPLEPIPPKDAAVKPGSPVPFTTGPMRAPSVDEKPIVEPLSKLKELPIFNIESEVMSIQSMIRAGNTKDATKSIYLASRKMALIYGIDVPDSMTHKEFLADISGRYPALSQPLSSIIYPYELVTFAGREAAQPELNNAVDGLKELYTYLENREVI